jgi:hypothetical protein
MKSLSIEQMETSCAGDCEFWAGVAMGVGAVALFLSPIGWVAVGGLFTAAGGGAAAAICYGYNTTKKR